MAKAEERSTTSTTPDPSPGKAAALSPEDAERAAAAFSPLWQLAEAPFTAGPQLPAAEVQALAEAPGVTLDPEPSSGSATIPIAPAPTPPVAAPPAAEDGVTDADLVPDEGPSASDTAPTDMPRTFHQPILARPPDPVLPTVIVEESEPVLAPTFTPAAPADVVPAAPADVAASVAAIEPAPKQSFRKTDPAITRMAPPPRVKQPVVAPAEEYQVPRSRLPLVIGWGALGCVVVGLAVYLFFGVARSGPRATPGVSAALAHTAPEPAVTIPPPPPADEAPPAPPTATAQPAFAPVATVTVGVSAPTAAQAAEPTPPPRRAPAPAAEAQPAPPRAARPMRNKPPSPTPAPGNIVRVNPF
jgi:hypothetical protein